jgi:NAD+ synthetase
VANLVGGNGGRVFAGASLVLDARGEPVAAGAAFGEDLLLADLDAPSGGVREPDLSGIEGLYEALKLGLADFVYKSGFRRVVLGLSGGIDSAVTAALAAEALGPEAVVALEMPSGYTSAASRQSARQVAENLGIRRHALPIDETRQAVEGALAPVFGGAARGVAEENIQARIRGLLLMAYANKFGAMPLATGNRSELAVGYCTLYGDTAGGLAPIGDVPKTVVYELAARINRERGPIPRRTIEQAPSAELRPNQTDQDDLPPYEVLDRILELWLDEGMDAAQIAGQGFQRELVEQVVARVRHAGFKRQQSPPALRVFSRGPAWPDLPPAGTMFEN